MSPVIYDRNEPEGVYQGLQGGIPFRHFTDYPLCPCKRGVLSVFPERLPFPENQVRNVYLCQTVGFCHVLLQHIRNLDTAAERESPCTFRPFTITVHIGKEYHGTVGKHPHFINGQLALSSRGQPYAIGVLYGADDGSLLRFHHSHHLVPVCR